MAIVIQGEPSLTDGLPLEGRPIHSSERLASNSRVFVCPSRPSPRSPKGVAQDLAIVLDGELVGIHLAIHL
jgi:hypothetical protein